MKYPQVMAALAALPVAVVILYAARRPSGPEPVVAPTGEALHGTTARPTALAPQTNEEGAVAVTVTPKVLSRPAPLWTFDVSLQTHSVELSEDLAAVSVLVADGQEYRPRGWQGSKPGGHHREGELAFDAVRPWPDAVEIKIRSVGGVAERTFQWKMP